MVTLSSKAYYETLAKDFHTLDLDPIRIQKPYILLGFYELSARTKKLSHLWSLTTEIKMIKKLF